MLSERQPNTRPVPLDSGLYTLGQCSTAVRVALDEYEAGRCALQESVRAAYDALCEEQRALVVQLQARGLHVRADAPGFPAVAATQVAVLGRLVFDNHRLGQRLAAVLRPTTAFLQ